MPCKTDRQTQALTYTSAHTHSHTHTHTHTHIYTHTNAQPLALSRTYARARIQTHTELMKLTHKVGHWNGGSERKFMVRIYLHGDNNMVRATLTTHKKEKK